MSIDTPSPSSLRYIYSSIKARQCLNMLRVFGFSFDDVYVHCVHGNIAANYERHYLHAHIGSDSFDCYFGGSNAINSQFNGAKFELN